MYFIGSHYDINASVEGHRNSANQVLSPDIPRNGHTVQALLLFAITLHARDEQTLAQNVLTTSIQLALDLGMNRQDFASEHGEGYRPLEESWRRTWWELYVADGMLAALHQQNSFKLYSIETYVLLPCEEGEYLMGDVGVCSPLLHEGLAKKIQFIYEPHTMSEFQDRAFASNEVVYSSFAYRIEATRLLGSILEVGQLAEPSNEDQVDAVDSSLVAWLLHLPPSKREVVDNEGKVDEMLFQAHMILQAGLIYLHRPRSDLVFAPIEEKTACTRPEPYKTPVSAHHIHSKKAIQAANKLSNLISLPLVLTNHSPFFTCAITLSAIVHLSASSIMMYSDRGNVLRERILLATGALKAMSAVWAIAESVLKQVKEVARAVLSFQPQNLSILDVFTDEVLDENTETIEHDFRRDGIEGGFSENATLDLL